MARKPGRPGAAKAKKGGSKGAPKVGTGGKGRQALEGRGPTPKAEDRKYHPAAKAKALRERKASVTPRVAKAKPGTALTAKKGEFLAPGSRTAGNAGGAARSGRRVQKAAESGEVLSGRNSVLEALRAKVPATSLFIAARIEMDDRVKEAISLANARGISVGEVTRPEMDRMTGHDAVHQGVALQVPPYNYQHPSELLDKILARGQKPLLVALDGITDPRNLGAIIRSVAAFGGQGVIVPQRRSVGVTASAWKTSAGAASRVPVALAANLNATIKEFQKRGLFVVGLDGGGDMSLPTFKLGNEPLLLVIGSEGKGLSRLVQENCDAILSIPIARDTESLNAGIAASVALYEVSKARIKNIK
jgi:23S rRNA (guanosine2251-2'-O)-methyltransferase